MTRLSVNINKVALLRNARGGNVPDVQAVALDCERFGAEGITVHPRPDERHIRRTDVYALKPLLTTEFNVEGYPSKTFMQMMEEVRPHQATLVPDPPDALTSSEGWDTIKHKAFLTDVIAELKSYGIRTSIFMETDEKKIEGAKAIGADRIELYTGPYAEQYPEDPEGAVEPYARAGKFADNIGLGVNAGHDLNLDNLAWFRRHLPFCLEVSIGHALINDALYFGLENTIGMYLRALK